jgi:hypothetical protein
MSQRMKILPQRVVSQRVLPERVLSQPTKPLELPKYLDLINELGLGDYVDYDAMVCRRSSREKKPRRDVYIGK